MKRISKIMLAGIMFVMGGGPQNPPIEEILRHRISYHGMVLGSKVAVSPSFYCVWLRQPGLPGNWAIGHTRQSDQLLVGGFKVYINDGAQLIDSVARTIDSVARTIDSGAQMINDFNKRLDAIQTELNILQRPYNIE